MTVSFFGAEIERREDVRLVKGAGTFVDDLMSDALHAAFVRSEHAHARIVSIDIDAALDVAGVVGIYTYDDFVGTPLAAPIPMIRPHVGIQHARTPYLLAKDEVNHVGQPIVMVLATDRYIAEDALAVIRVTYEALPVAIDLARAYRGEEGPAHSDMDGNLFGRFTEEVGSVAAALAAASRVIDLRLTLHRAAGTPLECRAVLAEFDRSSQRMRIWDTTQGPMLLPPLLSPILGLEPQDIEAISPDVGGGFGVKNFLFYAEEALIPWAARQVGRPVKWVEDRREHFIGSNQSRSQIADIKVGVDPQGHILAMDVSFLFDAGAFCQFGMLLPTITASQLSGNYRIPNLRYEYRGVFTNTTQSTPYRGSGQSYATFFIERVMDKVAGTLGIDRAEIRRRNLIPPDAFPHHVGLINPLNEPTVYDSGNYEVLLNDALAAIDYESFNVQQQAAARDGRRIGIGIAFFIEGTGIGPYEGARVEVLADGSVTAAAGSSDTGQGHETIFAQLVASELGVPMERVRVVTGDSRRLAYGIGSWASRTTVVAGNAVTCAAKAVAGKAKGIAAYMFKVTPDELEIVEGMVRVKVAPHIAISLGDLSLAARFMPPAEGGAVGLSEAYYWAPRSPPYSSGVHAAVVEIKPDTYDVRILRYVLVHDCGKVINPLLVRGQVLGGFAHGVADALFERKIYDESGQLLNASFMDYLMPFAAEIPPIELRHFETPSPVNPLGVKGVGEGGTIAVPAVIASAIEHALGVAIDAMPQSPLTLFELMRERDGADDQKGSSVSGGGHRPPEHVAD